VAIERGDYGRAVALHEESLALRRELGDKWGIASSLGNLGLVAFERGDYARAVALLEEGLALARDIGAKHRVTECLEGLATVAGALDQPERAARLFGTADALRAALGAPLPPRERARREQAVAALRDALGEAAFAAAWAEGRALSLEDAVALALEDSDAVRHRQ
jgi:tetratricopeptide (TPR) repeat protein